MKLIPLFITGLGLIATATGLEATAQRMAVLSDIHVSPGNRADSVLRVAVDEINRLPFDLVIVNGDLTNEGADHELNNVHKILSGIKHPIFVVPGNHENNWSQSAGKAFNDLWGNDRFLTTVGNLGVVGINCGPYLKMGDGHIKQEDLHWLKNALDSLCNDPNRLIVNYNHYPLRKDDLDNYAEYVNLLEQYPVIIHINGHYHHWESYMAGDIQAVMTRALHMNDNTEGYTIVDFTPNSIAVYDKVLQQDPVLKYTFPIKANHTKTDFLRATMPASVKGFDITCVHADSASIFTMPLIDSEAVYFGTSTGKAVALDRATHKSRWTNDIGGSLYGRPVKLNNITVAVPYNSGIKLLSAFDGSEIKNIPSANGPYIADGVVDNGQWLSGAYKRFECRDVATGEIKWIDTLVGNYCQAAPAVVGDEIITGAWDTYLRSYDRNTGNLNWKWSNGKSNNLFSPGNVVPVVTGTQVIIVAPDRYMTAIDRKTGQTIWRDNSVRYRESLGVSNDGKRVYAKTMDGELVAVATDQPQFTQLWKVDLGLGYDHAPCPIVEVENVVYTGSRSGNLTATDVSDPTHPVHLWTLPFGVSETNGFAVDPATGEVFVTLIEGTVWRIKKAK